MGSLRDPGTYFTRAETSVTFSGYYLMWPESSGNDKGKNKLAVHTSIHETDTALPVTMLFRGSSQVSSVNITV